MTRPRYEPVPRGYVRVWVVCSQFGTSRVIRKTHRDAEFVASCWGSCKVTPLDIPAGAIPGLGTTKKRKGKR